MSLFPFFRSPITLGFTLFLSLLPTLGSATGLALGILPIATPVASPSPATIPATELEFTLEAINARRSALQKEISRTRADFDQLPTENPGETALWLTQEIVILARLDGLYGEQLRTLQHAADLSKEAAEVAELIQNPRPPEVRLKPPHGLRLLDRLYSERDYLVDAKARLKTDVENATTALADARDELDDRNRLRRTAKETLNETPDHTKSLGALRLADLERRQAQETVLLSGKALETIKLQKSLIEPKLTLLLADFEWLHAHLVISEADLTDAKTKQDKRLAELDAALEAARIDADQVARLVISTERRNVGAVATTIDDELESRRADRQTVQLILSALTAQRDRLATFVEVLDLRRRTLTRESTPAEMKALAETNRDALERLEKSRRPRFTELRNSRKELQDLQVRLADTPTLARRPQTWSTDRVKHLTTWVSVNEQELADLADLTTARNRLQEELSDHVTTFSWSESLTSTRASLTDAWNYEVFSITDQPIRVKTILAVIALVLAGHWVSRRASDLIGRVVFHRLGMNTGRRAAWQTLSFYAFFLIVILTAINLFHLSLTQFSVVSGALAVGIGFGSQNLIGNFISGIILLIERPVSQGDVIEINGHQMTVERVGPRSTLVRSRDNTHVIVPNSRLLEENVVNLTLSDDVIRTRIHVGVAYGSPTREVERLLEEVIGSLDRVAKEPVPLVIFTDFGESALNFEASFWSALEPRKDVESELRHRIAEAFTKAGILMAFPQRDVHLETSKPLQVEVITAQAGAPTA